MEKRLVWAILGPEENNKPEGYKNFQWYAECYDESDNLVAAVYAKRSWQLPRRMMRAEKLIKE